MDIFWLIPQKIAGGSLPRDSSDINTLISYNIKHVISLIEDPSNIREIIKVTDIELHNIPIIDYSTPTQSQIQVFLSITSYILSHNQAVFVHCFGGCGRTGMMLAVYLVNSGYKPVDAIKKIRTLRPCSIETEEQEKVVLDFWSDN